MDKIIIDPLRLRAFEFDAKGYAPDFDFFVFGRLQSILSYTLEEKKYVCVRDNNRGRRVNPSYEEKCVSRLVEEISRLRFRGLSVDERGILMSCVYSWESWRKEEIAKAVTQRDIDSIKLMFSNPNTANNFVSELNKLLKKDSSTIEIGQYVANFHNVKQNFIKPKWRQWKPFWHELLRCLNIDKGRTYKREQLITESKKRK